MMLKVHKKHAMILRQHVGDGELGDEKITVSTAMTGATILHYRGRFCSIDMEAFVQAAAKAIDKTIEDEERECEDGLPG